MNEDTKFLLDRIDQNHKEVMSKIDHILEWKNKIAGASMAITALVSALVSAITAFLTGK